MALVITSAVITNAGENLFAQVVAGSGAMTITSVQFGSGFPALGDNVASYTGLKHFVMNGQITGANNLVQSQATIRVNLSSANAPSTFQVNEFGVFSQLGAQPSVMIAYGTTGAANGDTVTPSLPSSAIVKDYAILVLFSQAVPSSTTVTLQQVVGLHAANHLDNGIDPIPVATNLRAGLLKNTPNNATQVAVGTTPQTWATVPQVTHTNPGGMPITPLLANTSPFTASDGSVSWQPGLQVLTANATLFVATTGNNATAVLNDPAHPWANISGALTFLGNYFIFPGVTATISIAAGNYTSASQISVVHPQGTQINIIGTTSTGTVTGGTFTSGNVTLTGTFTGFATGDYVNVACLNNANTLEISGCWQLTSASATSISYATGLSALGGALGTPTGTVTRLRSSLTFSATINGISVGNGGLGLIQGFAVVGTPSGANIIVGFDVTNSGFAVISNCGFIGWFDTSNNSKGAGSDNGGNLTINNSNVSRCANGFISGEAQMNLNSCGATSNTSYGIRFEGSRGSINTSWSIGNNFIGAGINNTSYVTVVASNFFYNGSFGLQMQFSSSVAHGSGGGAAGNGGGADLFVGVLSSFIGQEAGSGTFNAATTNITPLVLSAKGGWIQF